MRTIYSFILIFFGVIAVHAQPINKGVVLSENKENCCLIFPEEGISIYERIGKASVGKILP